MNVTPTIRISNDDAGDVLRIINQLCSMMPEQITVQGGTISREQFAKEQWEIARTSCQSIAQLAFDMGRRWANKHEGK